jgi:putative membrane protein
LNLPIDLTILPAVNAGLNTTAAILLVAAWRSIRLGRIRQHAWLMGAAVLVSALFLTSYVTYHYMMRELTGEAHTTFIGPPVVRAVYLVILATHVVLAMAVVPMVIVVLYFAARRRFHSHLRVARWTLPIWLYVSVTGVLIYAMLYHIWPA